MQGLTLIFIFALIPYLGLCCRVAPKFCGVYHANGTFDFKPATFGNCPTERETEACKCGQANRSKREANVVGGEETEANEYPWQVGLVSRNGRIPWCGGSLISKRHVLTAAHCTYGKSPSQIGVLVGEHDTSDSVADIRTVIVITNHPEYSPSNQVNDISIITLSSDITITRTISPICLPWSPWTTAKKYAGDVATLTGWGRVSGGGPLSPTLQEADITVASNEDCRNSYASSSWPIKDSNICAGDPDQRACNGDSGGPLVIQEYERFAVIGVVSWGRTGCASKPTVFTRVSEYKFWIKSVTSGTVQDTSCSRNS